VTNRHTTTVATISQHSNWHYKGQ